MYNHIVLFKLRDYADQNEKSRVCCEIKNALLQLEETIREIRYIEVGINVLNDAGAFDISLITRFDSEAAFKTYHDHPEHLKVVQLVRQHAVNRAVTDYND